MAITFFETNNYKYEKSSVFFGLPDVGARHFTIPPMIAGEGYGTVKVLSNILLYVCLSFIMINVGREFVLDKVRWKSYAEDYLIAMATAALPWFMIAIYYVFVLLPPDYWNSWEAWKENLLLSRFAAPTSPASCLRCWRLSG